MPSNWLSKRFSAILLAVAVAASIIASGVAVYRRQAAVSWSPSVDLAVDYDEVLRSANALNFDPVGLLKELRAAGLTSLIIHERTLQEVKDYGEAGVLDGSELANQALVGRGDGLYEALKASGLHDPWSTYVITPQPGLAESVQAAVARRLGQARTGWFQFGEARVVIIKGVTREEGPSDPRTGRATVSLTTLAGYWPTDFAAARVAGLRVIPVLANDGRPGPVGIERIITQIETAVSGRPATVVLFNEDEALGYPGGLAATTARLKNLGWAVGVVRGQRPAGLGEIVHAMDYRAVKAAAVTPDARPEDNLLAAKDRAYRLLIISPFMYPSADAPTMRRLAADFTASLRDGLARSGLSPGAAAPIHPFALPRGPAFLIGWGVLAAAWAVFEELIHGAARLRWPWLIASGLAAGAATYAGLPALWLELLALVAAVVYSAWGVLILLRAILERRFRPGFGSALGQATTITALSIAGGTVVTALLASPAYILELSLFRGVKFAFVLPLLLVALAFLAETAGEGRAIQRAVEAVEHPLSFGDALWLGLAGLFGLVYLGRSGNFPALPVTRAESRLRVLLDRLLEARPRTKEFLIGQPATVLLGFRPWANQAVILALSLLAVVGQVSVVNSFAHLHTPYPLSLIRSLNGLILGLITGLVLAAAVGLFVGPRGTGVRGGSEPS
ncbi:MAG TPA: DUF5693 family protein [Bacillota bacterium]